MGRLDGWRWETRLKGASGKAGKKCSASQRGGAWYKRAFRLVMKYCFTMCLFCQPILAVAVASYEPHRKAFAADRLCVTVRATNEMVGIPARQLAFPVL